MIDQMPTLRRGLGRSPDQGGCLVQIANWLCDHTLWTDGSQHVNPVLRFTGVNVNDAVGDEARAELALAVVRIAGTRRLEPDLENALETYAREVLGMSVDGGCGCPMCQSAGLNPPGQVSFYSLPDEAKVNGYFQVIDRYYELAGDEEMTFAPEVWAELAMAMRPKVSLVKASKVTQWHTGWSNMTVTFAQVGASFTQLQDSANKIKDAIANAGQQIVTTVNAGDKVTIDGNTITVTTPGTYTISYGDSVKVERTPTPNTVYPKTELKEYVNTTYPKYAQLQHPDHNPNEFAGLTGAYWKVPKPELLHV